MKAHRFDAVSFIAGLLFTAVGLLFLVPKTPDQMIDALVNSGAWFWPILLLVVGIIVIVPALLPKREQEAIEGEDQS